MVRRAVINAMDNLDAFDNAVDAYTRARYACRYAVAIEIGATPEGAKIAAGSQRRPAPGARPV